MMYSVNPQSMPMMSKMTLAAGKNYNVTIVAYFDDGTTCSAFSVVMAQESGGMTSMIISTYGMMTTTTRNIMTTSMMQSETTIVKSTTSMMSQGSTGMVSSTKTAPYSSSTSGVMSMNTTSHMMG